MMFGSIVCILLGALVQIGLCQTEEGNLATFLIKNYERVNPYLTNRPVLASNETVNVSFGLMLVEVVDYDAEKSTATISFMERMGWNDPMLKWEPTDFGNVKEIRIPADRIWQPDIVLYNKATSDNEVIPARFALVSSNGDVNYVPQSVRKVKCVTDPEDQDSAYCSLIYGSWAFDITKVNVDLYDGYEGIDVETATLLSPSTQWYVQGTDAYRTVQYYDCCAEHYASLFFHLDLKKQKIKF